MSVTPDEPFYCSGTICQPTFQPEGNGFCYREVRDCVIESGYAPKQQFCASTQCNATSMDYERKENDVCTEARHSCLYASKHKFYGGYPFRCQLQKE